MIIHVEHPVPHFHGITNCESCHVQGTNEVPDQSKSLPGLLSGSDSVQGLGQKYWHRAGLYHRACFTSLWFLPQGQIDQRR